MPKAERFEDFHARLREFQARQITKRVSPMQPVEQGDAVQVVLMESWLDDELKCQASGDHPCGEKVTATALWCRDPLFLCAEAERRGRAAIAADFNTCGACKRRVVDCWRVVSI